MHSYLHTHFTVSHETSAFDMYFLNFIYNCKFCHTFVILNDSMVLFFPTESHTPCQIFIASLWYSPLMK